MVVFFRGGTVSQHPCCLLVYRVLLERGLFLLAPPCTREISEHGVLLRYDRSSCPDLGDAVFAVQQEAVSAPPWSNLDVRTVRSCSVELVIVPDCPKLVRTRYRRCHCVDSILLRPWACSGLRHLDAVLQEVKTRYGHTYPLKCETPP